MPNQLRPLLSELRRLVRGLQLFGARPLDVIDQMAPVHAAMQIDRNEPWLTGHEAGTLDHEIECLLLIIGR
jgi:hypothetical protein